MTTTADPPTAHGELDIWGASQLHVLSVGRGHLTLNITEGNEAEIDLARKVITDMMARGYAIFVEDADGSAVYRVKEFNPAKMVYIIDAPDDAPDDTITIPEDVTPADTPPKASRRGRKKATKEVPVSGARATAVGRTAGG